MLLLDTVALRTCRHLDDTEIKEELSRFKGVGPKTIACVLMFCLQRKEFPVDTHVSLMHAKICILHTFSRRDKDPAV